MYDYLSINHTYLPAFLTHFYLKSYDFFIPIIILQELFLLEDFSKLFLSYCSIYNQQKYVLHHLLIQLHKKFFIINF